MSILVVQDPQHPDKTRISSIQKLQTNTDEPNYNTDSNTVSEQAWHILH